MNCEVAAVFIRAADTVGSAALAVLALAAVVVVLPDIYDANEMISVAEEQSATAGCTEMRLQIPLPVVLYGQNTNMSCLRVHILLILLFYP